MEKPEKVVKVEESVEKYMEKSKKVEESVEKSKSWTIRKISRRVPMIVWNAIDKYVEARVLKYIVLKITAFKIVKMPILDNFKGFFLYFKSEIQTVKSFPGLIVVKLSKFWRICPTVSNKCHNSK